MSTTTSEPVIATDSREQLLYMLAEAAEIEHNLMCCYLFAAFSLKRGADEGLSDAELDSVRRWRKATVAVAVEEMTHLALVSNLTVALGGAAHFARPNFPVGAGLYPSGLAVRLAPFDRETLQHFLYLERPEGVEVPDGASFVGASGYVRETVVGKAMPSAQDYFTVGHLYRELEHGVRAMVARQGEAATFIGDPALQLGADLMPLPGMAPVTNLTSAVAAIATIIRQGEGARTTDASSHYCHFLAIAREYDTLAAARADFVPHRPVAHNPVMRKPPQPRDKVFVDAPEAAAAMDLANAVYGLMLRCLGQCYAHTSHGARRILADTATSLMFAIVPLADWLTTLPASSQHPGVTAGMSFAMLRDVAPLPRGRGALAFLAERLADLAATAAQMGNRGAAAPAEAAKALAGSSAAFAIALNDAESMSEPDRSTATPAPAPAPQRDVPASIIEDGIEIVHGKSVTLRFEAKRCIHSRYCVLRLPNVYKANVEGAWIDPDAATVEANIGVAHDCPSGAIRYERGDGGSAEPAPLVNQWRVLENGPYAVRAPIVLSGTVVGFRATLCRCGASMNKPFCDGSHHELGFVATGEPATGEFKALAIRDGKLKVEPQRNGPLRVSGNLEIISGTGRTVMKTTSAAFCRCGHSANKPYCDGTHAKIGFEAD